MMPKKPLEALEEHFADERTIPHWIFNDHEGGEAFQVKKQVEFLQTLSLHL